MVPSKRKTLTTPYFLGIDLLYRMRRLRQKGDYFVANRGNDSETIISPIPFATKDLTHFPFLALRFVGGLLRH
jgi:hypothetical protein